VPTADSPTSAMAASGCRPRTAPGADEAVLVRVRVGPVCIGCAPQRVSACVRCDQLAPATANWAEGPGLRPLLRGGPAPPRHLRQLPRHPPARRPGRPGRDHLRRLRRTGPPPTCASTAGPRASSTRAAGANGARWPAAPVSCCDPVVASRSPPRADGRPRSRHQHNHAAHRVELAAERSRCTAARRHRRWRAGLHPPGAGHPSAGTRRRLPAPRPGRQRRVPPGTRPWPGWRPGSPR